MRRTSTLALAIAFAATPLVPASLAAQAFDFESVAQGAYPSLVVTNGGQTLTVTTTTGAPVSVFGAPPAGFGGRAVVGGEQPGPFVPLRFGFATPVGSVTFLFGDLGSDDDSPVVFQAFDAADVRLGTWSSPYVFGQTGAVALTASVGSAASCFTANGGGVNGNSLYYEIAASTPFDALPPTTTPEPATLTLLAAGLGALAEFAVRRRSAA